MKRKKQQATLVLTFYEAALMLAKEGMVLVPESDERIWGDGVGWKIIQWSRKEMRYVLVRCYFQTWMSALSDHLGRPVEDAAE